MVFFKIYYDNGTTYSSEDGSWNDAPLDGIIFVIEINGEKVNVHSGNDFYYLEDDTIASTGDLNPLLRKMKFIKFGRWTSHKTYEKLSELVRDDIKKW